MADINFFDYQNLIFRSLELSSWESQAERRRGAKDRLEKNIKLIIRDLKSANNLLADNKISEKKALIFYTDLALEATSLFYAAGIRHHEWKKWSALTSAGLYLQENFFEASQFAALANDWEFLNYMFPKWTRKTIFEKLFWAVFKDEFVTSLEYDSGDFEQYELYQLSVCLLNRDFLGFEDSIKKLSDFWLGEDEDYLDFHSRSSPDFEPLICAFVAIARYKGYRPLSLNPEQYLFLEPGLAEQIECKSMLTWGN